ncbi:MAG: twin-arginine translocase TatA/TatE family subunit [Desulfobacteraceae bacterium]|nr:twin-arginine translocase TatA/TatE family subunit [Desulfobacteraceae bacterium]
MFGIGLPELIVILALALIVVGPERLPELARSLAKGVLEIKKAANTLRDTIQEEMDEAGKTAKPWEQLPQGQPPAKSEPPETAAQEPPAEEGKQRQDVLPESGERKAHGTGEDEKLNR